jgi:two-component system response regulator PilR (NtrC family)
MEHAKGRILIIEDEKSMREVLRILLEEEEYEVTTASGGLEGIEYIRNNIFDLVITDIKMPGADGFQVLIKTKEISPSTIVIMVTAFGTTESAIDAMKKGAYDYIHKPFKIDEIRLIVKKAFEKKNLSEEVSLLREKFRSSFGLENIIGKSAVMQELFKLIPRVANSNSAVFISGESGTGKELVATALHNLSPRKNKNFVTINCATFPEGLLESEMFGHMKGSFTGAVSSKSGLFEIADGGTFFLDEIGEMPLSLQSKLLRVLENGIFRRVGGTTDIKVDVRVISATNINILEAVAAGTFREDLFYRLNVVPLTVPPLRERTSDIPILVDHFLFKFSKDPRKLSHEAMELFMNYSWKGNVRELEHVVERVVLLSDKEVITPEDLPAEILQTSDGLGFLPDFGDGVFDLEKLLEKIEKDYLLKALDKTNGVKTEAARVLNLSFRSFRHRLSKYGIK